MKGYRTLIFNVAAAAFAAGANSLAGIDWTQHLSPQNAVIAAAVVNIGLRFITTSKVGGK